MINIRDNFHIIEDLSELPNLKNRKEIFCDIESQRVFDDEIGGMYVFKGDRICGISITADDIKDIWYIPVRHTNQNANNLPIKNVMDWARDILQSCYEWINHHVKFDAMFFDIGDNVEFKCRLICTVILSKLYYSDRMNYGLKSLCKDWLDYDIGSTDRVAKYKDSIKSKSYSDVPEILLGEYANDDVQMNRMLYRFLQKELQGRIESSLRDDGSNTQGDLVKNLIETEIKLTPVLFDMEKTGLHIDERECLTESLNALKSMVAANEQISKITGHEFTNSNSCLQEILLNQFKLPILSTIIEKEDGVYIDTGRPSFDKDAMALYLAHPSVTCNENIRQVVNLISDYRTDQQFKSLFLDTFLRLNVNGVVHPSYNQAVRTGRLSCSKPNSQQQNARSKKLIHPPPSHGFLSNDYSQIEYRMIVHYCNILAAIEAYNKDPKTDYHKWVAELLQILRKPAKQLNFGMAFGQGEKSVTNALMTNEQIMEGMGSIVNKLVAEGQLSESFREAKFKELCKKHAKDSYRAYHTKLPEIRKTFKKAADVAQVRGFIFTAYGRRRYLPGNASRNAFPSIMQGSAADIMKERLVAISPRYNSESKRLGIILSANVHDELLNAVPLDNLYSPDVHSYICDTLENTTVKFKVPILTGLGISKNNWAEAAQDERINDEQGNFVAGKLR